MTATGRGMVLGNPHFPWQGRYRFTQTQLTIPGEYDVRGAMLHGSPVVNIGWNDDVAWTHTVSTAYRFTPYEYRLVPGMPTTYVTEDGVQELERREVEIELPDGSTVTEDLYRTPEGYVVDDQAGRVTEGLLTWTAASVWAIRDANAEHLKTLDAFHEMGKAQDVDELARRRDRQPGHPVGQHHGRRSRTATSCTPTTRSCHTSTDEQGPAVRHAHRRGAGPAGRPAGAGRHPCPGRLRLGQRPGRTARRRLRRGQPARHPQPAGRRDRPELGHQRQRQLLAAQPRRPR